MKISVSLSSYSNGFLCLERPDPMFNLFTVMINPANFAKHRPNLKVAIIAMMTAKVNEGWQ